MHPFCRSIWLAARGAEPTLPAPDPVCPDLAREILGPRVPADLLAALCEGVADAVVADLRAPDGAPSGRS